MSGIPASPWKLIRPEPQPPVHKLYFVDCELLIRAPSDRRSLFSVRDGISAVISTACE